ncbi:MAG: hypothetical protein ACK4R8_10400 [Thiobacillus sp.]
MRPSAIILLVLSGIFAPLAGLCRAEPSRPSEAALGRLFFTPEWRATLERQRQLNLQHSRSIESEQLRLDGVVVRSSGKSTVWINGQPQSENSHDTGITVVPSRRYPGHAVLSTGAAPSVDLEVGVALDQETGEKRGGLTDGKIRIHRRTASRP